MDYLYKINHVSVCFLLQSVNLLEVIPEKRISRCEKICFYCCARHLYGDVKHFIQKTSKINQIETLEGVVRNLCIWLVPCSMSCTIRTPHHHHHHHHHHQQQQQHPTSTHYGRFEKRWDAHSHCKRRWSGPVGQRNSGWYPLEQKFRYVVAPITLLFVSHAKTLQSWQRDRFSSLKYLFLGHGLENFSHGIFICLLLANGGNEMQSNSLIISIILGFHHPKQFLTALFSCWSAYTMASCFQCPVVVRKSLHMETWCDIIFRTQSSCRKKKTWGSWRLQDTIQSHDWCLFFSVVC